MKVLKAPRMYHVRIEHASRLNDPWCPSSAGGGVRQVTMSFPTLCNQQYYLGHIHAKANRRHSSATICPLWRCAHKTEEWRSAPPSDPWRGGV